MLPAITEEKVGASGTGETEQYKVNENYPLKQALETPEVLLINYPDMKETLVKKIGLNVKESSNEQEANELLEYSLK